ncbi:MAG: small multi-drug export protein [Candidatus Kappaea frigidicola]|nr:small multi-drug export protein [Candidatus Kappaea frigidicola]
MTQVIIEYIYNYLTSNLGSKELITAILAMLPIVEARYAILIAHVQMDIGLQKAFLICILANMVPIIPILLFVEPICDKLRHFRLWRSFFDNLFERTKKKAALVERYESLGLILFVAVPLPITGAWTGALAAVLFKLKTKYAFLSIFIGVIISSLITISIYLIGTEGFSWLKQFH